MFILPLYQVQQEVRIFPHLQNDLLPSSIWESQFRQDFVCCSWIKCMKGKNQDRLRKDDLVERGRRDEVRTVEEVEESGLLQNKLGINQYKALGMLLTHSAFVLLLLNHPVPLFYLVSYKFLPSSRLQFLVTPIHQFLKAQYMQE